MINCQITRDGKERDAGRTHLPKKVGENHTLLYKASAKWAIHPADGTVILSLPGTRLVEYKHIDNKKASTISEDAFLLGYPDSNQE